MRTDLIHTTKTLATLLLTGVSKFDQLMTHGTDMHTNKIENVIIGFMTDNGYKCITLSSSNLPEDGTAESCTEAVMDTFKEGRELFHCGTQKQKACSQIVLIFLP